MGDEFILTATEASKLLRLSIHQTLDKLDKGEIPAIREGRNWKVPKSLLIASIENRALKEAQGRREAYEKIQMEQEKV